VARARIGVYGFRADLLGQDLENAVLAEGGEDVVYHFWDFGRGAWTSGANKITD